MLYIGVAEMVGGSREADERCSEEAALRTEPVEENCTFGFCACRGNVRGLEFEHF